LNNKPNIAIIVIDTLRKDTFDKMQEEENRLEGLGKLMLFEKCIAPASWTLPSHASLFTGLYPSQHGAHETKTVKSLDIEHIKLKIPTFVSELNNQKYNTYCISANPYVDPIYGFDEFKEFKAESYFTSVFGSVFEIAEDLKPKIAKYRNLYETDIFKISKAMLKEDPNLFFETAFSALRFTPKSALFKAKAKLIDGWPIEKGGKKIARRVEETSYKKPFFLFINLMEAHNPYIGKKGKDMNWATSFQKEPVDKRLVDTWYRLYKKASEKGYDYAAAIAQSLLERYDNLLVIITSDHGQAFNEHGFIGHGTMLYDEIVRVPLALISSQELGLEEVQKKHHQSLVNIRKFLEGVIARKKDSTKLLYGNVYSESFGMPSNVDETKIDMKKLAKYDRYMIRKFD